MYDRAPCFRDRGKPAEELNNVAPYIFAISNHQDFEKWVDSRERKDPIARRTVRLTSELDLDELRRHLRRFLRVKKENGSFLYYRYYDPKVIAYTFPNLTDEQLNEFFAGISEIIHFSDTLHQKRMYTYLDGKLVMKIESNFKI